MREVDVDAKVLAEIDGLEPAAHAFKSRQPAADVFDLHAQRKAHACRAERVVDVETGRNVQGDLPPPHGSLHAESRPRPRAGKSVPRQVRRGVYALGTA